MTVEDQGRLGCERVYTRFRVPYLKIIFFSELGSWRFLTSCMSSFAMRLSTKEKWRLSFDPRGSGTEK